MHKYDIAIIGSGLGGLLCGSILSREGFNVIILEKNPVTGGCLQSYRRNGHIFDTGVHFIGSLDQGQVLDRYFRYFLIRDQLKLKRADEQASDIICYPDGNTYELPTGSQNFRESLLKYFPGEKKAIEDYISAMQKICKAFPLYNLNAKYERFKEQGYFNINTHQFFSELTSNHKLQNLLAATNFNYAGRSDKSPFYIHSLITNSLIESTWRLVDGSAQISTLLVKQIKENGGTVITNSEVTSLKLSSNTVSSLLVNGEQVIEATWVISDIHPSNTFSLLTDINPVRLMNKRIEHLENSFGPFTLNGYFIKDTFPFLNSNYFYHPQENPWIDQTSKQKDNESSFVFMTPPYSNTDQFADTFTILTEMDFDMVKKWEHTKVGARGNDYLEFKEAFADKLMESVDKLFPGFSSKVEKTYTSTPLTWQNYTGTPKGSMYGILKDSNDPIRSMVFPKNRISNLLFTGQNTILHGVIGVTIGSVQTCSEILGIEYLVNKINEAS
jgi:all-trans-retinol 13,14-reductase